MNTIRLLFLVETGHGMGHIIRCLNLARSFERRAPVLPFFLTLGDEGTDRIGYAKEAIVGDLSAQLIEDKVSQFQPDVFVMDILDIHSGIPGMLKRKNVMTCVIFDFVSNDEIPTDIIVNPNLEMLGYKNSGSQCLLGPGYMILGDCFSSTQAQIRQKVSSIMISMGGSDPRDYTIKAINALEGCDFNVDVVIGSLYKSNQAVKERISQLGRFNFAWDVANEDMCQLMSGNDILLSTAGNTMYEAAALGVPNIVFCNHQKHYAIAASFERKGVALNLGIEPEVNQITKAVTSLANDFTRRKGMARLGRHLVDGRGGERIAAFILEQHKSRGKEEII